MATRDTILAHTREQLSDLYPLEDLETVARAVLRRAERAARRTGRTLVDVLPDVFEKAVSARMEEIEKDRSRREAFQRWQAKRGGPAMRLLSMATAVIVGAPFALPSAIERQVR